MSQPSDDELDALLVVAYLYARIMSCGLGQTPQTMSPIRMHEDHSFLNQIDLGPGAPFSLAETSDALVGTCCRYGLDLLRRFFDNTYSNPVLLERTIALRTSPLVKGSLRLTYSDLVTSLLRDPGRWTEQQGDKPILSRPHVQ